MDGKKSDLSVHFHCQFFHCGKKQKSISLFKISCSAYLFQMIIISSMMRNLSWQICFCRQVQIRVFKANWFVFSTFGLFRWEWNTNICLTAWLKSSIDSTHSSQFRSFSRFYQYEWRKQHITKNLKRGENVLFTFSSTMTRQIRLMIDILPSHYCIDKHHHRNDNVQSLIDWSLLLRDFFFLQTRRDYQMKNVCLS